MLCFEILLWIIFVIFFFFFFIAFHSHQLFGFIQFDCIQLIMHNYFTYFFLPLLHFIYTEHGKICWKIVCLHLHNLSTVQLTIYCHVWGQNLQILFLKQKTTCPSNQRFNAAPSVLQCVISPFTTFHSLALYNKRLLQSLF
jgi:hypothetical protein